MLPWLILEGWPAVPLLPRDAGTACFFLLSLVSSTVHTSGRILAVEDHIFGSQLLDLQGIDPTSDLLSNLSIGINDFGHVSALEADPNPPFGPVESHMPNNSELASSERGQCGVARRGGP